MCLNRIWCKCGVLQVLVALACDLCLDSVLYCAEVHKWVWFRRYCLASRVASSLENRTQLPTAFREEVLKKVQEVSLDNERVDRDYEDASVFTREQDEQLLLWLNRYNENPASSSNIQMHCLLITYSTGFGSHIKCCVLWWGHIEQKCWWFVTIFCVSVYLQLIGG